MSFCHCWTYLYDKIAMSDSHTLALSCPTWVLILEIRYLILFLFLSFLQNIFIQDEERCRNSFSLDVLYVHISHPLAVKILTFYEGEVGHPNLPNAKVEQKINPKFRCAIENVTKWCL